MQQRNFELLLYPSDEPSQPRRLTACTVNYNAAQVPDAIIRLAVGKPIAFAGRVPDNVIPADWLDPLRKLRIAVRIKNFSARTQRETTEEKVLFEGYPNAPSIEIGSRSGEISINLQHWLRDLASGSMLHEYAYPMTPEQRELEVLYPIKNEAGNTTGLGSVGNRIGLPLDWRLRLPLDIWANGLKPVLTTLATNQFNGDLFDKINCANQINQVSPTTVDALRRIQGPSQLLGRPYSEGGAPLRIRADVSGSLNSVITDAIAKLIGDQSLGVYRGVTFWDHMLYVFSNLFLDIIPRPTDALIVPFVPTPYGFYETQILEDAIQHISWAETSQLNIRGTMVIAPRVDTRGFDAIEQQKDSKLIAAGCYVDTDDPRLGRIYPIDAPAWLAKLRVYSDTNGLIAGRRREEPNNGTPPGQPPPPPPLSVGDMFDRYAQLRYIEEALRFRRAVISTAFRTDIAVGSTVAVSSRSDAIGSTAGSTTTTIIGRVVGSTHQIDRTSLQATSSFSLAYVTTLAELQSQRYVVDTHPIFDSRFLGTFLV